LYVLTMQPRMIKDYFCVWHGQFILKRALPSKHDSYMITQSSDRIHGILLSQLSSQWRLLCTSSNNKTFARSHLPTWKRAATCPTDCNTDMVMQVIHVNTSSRNSNHDPNNTRIFELLCQPGSSRRSNTRIVLQSSTSNTLLPAACTSLPTLSLATRLDTPAPVTPFPARDKCTNFTRPPAVLSRSERASASAPASQRHYLAASRTQA